MHSLEILGFSSKDMFMGVVKEKYTGGNHMVLALHIDKNSPPLILDNLSIKILPIDNRVDLELLFMLNRHGFFRLENYKKLIEIKKILDSHHKRIP